MFDLKNIKEQKDVQLLREQEEEELAKILSVKYDVRYINLKTVSIKTDALKIVPEKKSRELKIIVFEKVGKKIKVAVISPKETETVVYLKKLEEKGYSLTIYMVSHKSIEKAWSRYAEMSYNTKTTAGLVDIVPENVENIFSKTTNLEDLKEILKDILNSKVQHITSRFFEAILAGALATGASDIHIEPEEDFITLRFRLDGVLVVVAKFKKHLYKLLLSRIKLISGLKLNVTKKPQDGRLSIKLQEKSVEIRVSVLPDAYGESIVLRLLDPANISVTIKDLGIEKNLFEILNKEIHRPNGMILNTGPTGSGKTTSLYAFLRKIHTPENKIITIENPIEYHLPGIVQTQINIDKGYTFLEGLKSSLRQDPDIIMVGEIRDTDTAKVAVNSALTGHLVFSTLHTNNAVGTFYRLIDLGIQANIISTAINIIIAQRLVRKPCEHCKKEVLIEEKDKEEISKILGEIDNVEKYTTNTEKMFVPVGCDECNNTGYKGRIGIFEAILVNAEISKLLEQNPGKEVIKTIFKQQGLLSLAQDGVIKVLNGDTTLDELRRVIDLE
ncbi:MAG: Flp pilus assembly complex ATPase component TadA [Candidatus Pacebacteria bacterium]|nr:Flp pilus assembly complex ATPase component TadA [Candidatus Paceibacterota bacterium]